MALATDLPGKLNFRWYSRNAHSVAGSWPASVEGRTFEVRIDGQDDPITVTVDVATVSWTVPAIDRPHLTQQWTFVETTSNPDGTTLFGGSIIWGLGYDDAADVDEFTVVVRDGDIDIVVGFSTEVTIEASVRAAADLALGERIDDETADRATADSVLAAALAAEVADRLDGDSATAATGAAALAVHEADTTNVHGIANTALLETIAGAIAKVNAHVAATDPHGDRAYADSLIATLLGGVPPGALDTVFELAAAIQGDEGVVTALTALVATKETPAGAQSKADAAQAAAIAAAILLVDDLSGVTNASAALTNLGVSAFIQTLLNDADQAAALATLGAQAVGTYVSLPASTVGELYVTPDGSDAADGLSWATAKASLYGALAAASSGSKIRMSGGTWVAALPHTIPSRVEVVGRRGATIISVPAGTATVTAGILDMDGPIDTTLRNVNVIAPGDGVTDNNTAQLIKVRGAATRTLIEGCLAQGGNMNFRFYGDEGTVPGTITDLTVRGCTSDYSGNYGFVWSNVDTVTVDDCHGTGCDLDQFKLLKNTKNIQLSNVSGKYSIRGDGLDCYAGGDTFSLVNAVFDHNGINGLTLKSDDLNHTDSATYGFVKNIIVTNVKCRYNVGHGAIISRDGNPDVATTPLMSCITMAGLIAEYNGLSGLFIRARLVSVFGPQCRRNGQHGIRVEPTALDVEVYGAHVAGNSTSATNTYDGVSIAGKRIRFFGGSSMGSDADTITTDSDYAALTATQRYGVSVVSGADDVIVKMDSLYNVTGAYNNATTGGAKVSIGKPDAIGDLLGVPFTFAKTGITAGSTVSATAGDGSVLISHVMPRAGRLVAMSVLFSTVITAGTVTAAVRKNSSGTNLATAVLDTTNTSQKITDLGYYGGVAYAAGDLMKLVLTASSDVAPTSGTYRVVVYFVPDQP